MNLLALTRHSSRWSRYLLAIGMLAQVLIGAGYNDSPTCRLRRPWQTELVVSRSAVAQAALYQGLQPTHPYSTSGRGNYATRAYQTASIRHTRETYSALHYAVRTTWRGTWPRNWVALKKIPATPEAADLLGA